jgi:hypothetical protein
MQWASVRLARSRAMLLALTVFTLGILLCPATAHAQVAGYCSDLALSDVAPAPMVPSSQDVLRPAGCQGHHLVDVGTPLPWDEAPAFSSPDRAERGWPGPFCWSFRYEPERNPLAAVARPRSADHSSGVFRPPR